MDFQLVLIKLLSVYVTAGALRANIDWKSAILKKGWSVSAKFHVVGDVSRDQFAWIDRPLNALQLCR